MKPTNTKLIAETANIVRLQLVSDKEFCFPNLMFFWCNCGKKKKREYVQTTKGCEYYAQVGQLAVASSDGIFGIIIFQEK